MLERCGNASVARAARKREAEERPTAAPREGTTDRGPRCAATTNAANGPAHVCWAVDLVGNVKVVQLDDARSVRYGLPRGSRKSAEEGPPVVSRTRDSRREPQPEPRGAGAPARPRLSRSARHRPSQAPGFSAATAPLARAPPAACVCGPFRLERCPLRTSCPLYRQCDPSCSPPPAQASLAPLPRRCGPWLPSPLRLPVALRERQGTSVRRTATGRRQSENVKMQERRQRQRGASARACSRSVPPGPSPPASLRRRTLL